MTGRLYPLIHALRDNGEAWGRALTWWGLVAFCAVSPISIAATNMAWAVALAGLLARALSRDVRTDGRLHRTDLDAPLLCFVLVSLVSVFLSLDILTSLVDARSLGLMVIVYLFAWHAKTPAQRKTLVRILVISSCVAALYGWIQFLTGWDFKGYYRPETGKVGGFFGLHLTYGEYLSMVICLGVGILLWMDATRLGRLRRLAVLGFLASALLLSGCKGAMLGLAAGLGVVFALRGGKALALYAVGGTLLFLALDISMSHRVSGDIVTLLQVDARQPIGPAASNAQRLCMWWAGLWISLEHFLFGVGLHAVEQIYPAFRHPLAIEPNQHHLHNNFVHLGVIGGMLGLAAFLYIFLCVFRLGSFRYRAEGETFDRGLAAGVLGASTAFLVAGFTEYNWGDSEVLMLLYMLLGLLASCGRQEGPLPRVQAGRPGVDPEGMGSALPSAPGRTGLTLLFVCLGAGLCSLPFLVVPASRSLRMGLLETSFGLLLLLLAFWGWKRRGPVPVWQRQACGGLVLCAGYHFTRGLWAGRQWLGVAEWFAWAGLIGFGLLSFLCCLLFRSYRKTKEPAILPDLAGIGALWTWSGMALVTHSLLRMATWREPLWAPPYIPLLLLTVLGACLYSAFRFSYWGGQAQRVLLALLGLCTLIHVLR